MDPFENELRNALRIPAPMPATDVARLNQQIAKEYRRKQRTAERILWVFLAGMLAAILFMYWLFFETDDPKLTLVLAIGILIAFEGTVLMKLWFWVIHSKFATIREIKLLQVLIAERLPATGAPIATDDPALAAGDVAADESANATWPSRPWRIVLPVVWLGALAGWVYCIWVRPDTTLDNAVLYYEKVLQPGQDIGKEWTDIFEVTQGMNCFHPILKPAAGHAQAQIKVGPEGKPYNYQGPLNDHSRFWFGKVLAPGRYAIRAKLEQADAGCTLRVYGTDAPRNERYPHAVLLMVLGGIVVGLPLVWLQYRALRRLDPDLAR